MVGGMPKIRTAMIEGPYNVTGVSASPSRDRISVCRPASAAEETACATRILTNLTRRAYRRPVTAADVQAPLDFYVTQVQNMRHIVLDKVPNQRDPEEADCRRTW